jgi:hypothetical protein
MTILVRYVLAVTIRKYNLNETENTPMTNASWFALLLLSTMILPGCEIIGDIFKAGVWVGVILVVLVIGLVVWLFSRART